MRVLSLQREYTDSKVNERESRLCCLDSVKMINQKQAPTCSSPQQEPGSLGRTRPQCSESRELKSTTSLTNVLVRNALGLQKLSQDCMHWEQWRWAIQLVGHGCTSGRCVSQQPEMGNMMGNIIPPKKCSSVQMSDYFSSNAPTQDIEYTTIRMPTSTSSSSPLVGWWTLLDVVPVLFPIQRILICLVN